MVQRDARARHNQSTPSRIAGGSSEECGKLSYETRKHARKAAKTSLGGDHLRPYRCPECRWWHNGHIAEAVMAGQLTTGELEEHNARPDAAINRARARVQGSKAITYNSGTLARRWADAHVADRSSPLWHAEVARAGKFLEWLAVEIVAVNMP